MFHALADATRRDIVARALHGEFSVSALARNYSMSFAAVQKHVAVLTDAGLVTKTKHGREQLVRTVPDALGEVHSALDRLETLWRERLHRFGDVLDQPAGGGVPETSGTPATPATPATPTATTATTKGNTP